MRVRDNGADAMVRRLSGGGGVSVGFVGPKATAKHADSDLTVQQIAAIHEFGLGRVPRRSIVADYFDEEHAWIVERVRAAAARIKNGVPRKEALADLGKKISDDMRRRVWDGIPPPLSDASIERHGHGVPLIRTGQLVEAISYEVRENG